MLQFRWFQVEPPLLIEEEFITVSAIYILPTNTGLLILSTYDINYQGGLIACFVTLEVQDLFSGVILSSAALELDPQAAGTLLVRRKIWIHFSLLCTCYLYIVILETCCQSAVLDCSEIWTQGYGSIADQQYTRRG